MAEAVLCHRGRRAPRPPQPILARLYGPATCPAAHTVKAAKEKAEFAGGELTDRSEPMIIMQRSNAAQQVLRMLSPNRAGGRPGD